MRPALQIVGLALQTSVGRLLILLAGGFLFSPWINAQTSTPAPIRTMVGLDQNPGAQLPLDTAFTDANGASVSLRDVIHDRPAVLLFGYFTCAQLCGVTLDGTLDALRQIKPSVGVDYDVVYLSINPADGTAAAAEKRASYARRYGRGAGNAGWHVLTGRESDITTVTQIAGFRYQAIAGTPEFAHPSGFLVIRPDGVIFRYFPGLDFRPAEITAALRQAAEGRTGHPVYDLLLVCFTGGLQPGLAQWAFTAVQIGAGLTVLALAAGIGWMLRTERRSRSRALEAPRP